MHDRTSRLWGTALVALLTLISAALVGPMFDAAHAQDLRGGYGYAKEHKKRVAGSTESHQSLIRVPEGIAGNYNRIVRLGLGKSVLVEFPRPVRDVMVSNPQVVDAVVLSANRVFLLARRIGEANSFFFDLDGDQFATLEIFVERDTAGLQDMLERLIPGSRIKVEMLGQSVVLTGSVRNPSDATRASTIASQFSQVKFEAKTTAEAEGTVAKADDGAAKDKVRVINLLQVDGEEQVMLRVVVAEVQRSILKQFGINVGALVNSGNLTTAILTEHGLPLTTAEGLGALPASALAAGRTLTALTSDTTGIDVDSTPFAGPNNAGSAFTNNGVAGAWGTGNQQINGVIRALERNGLIKTLAEPTLTAVSGETARFLAGGEFPVPVVDGQGRVSVVFKEFGVGVAFTPTVMSEGRISMKIEAEVSELSNQGAVQIGSLLIQSIKTRRASSTVELPSGGSLAMAGLLSEDTRQNVDGVPGLKDLPILGTLFRSRDFIKQETELVVMVTPYVVRPTARKNLARPADGYADATDMKANFLGHMNRIYGRGAAIPDGGLKGDYGFIVE